jgi:hypothetical protein
MPLTGAPSRDDANRKRRIFRVIAAVLAVIGVVLIIVRPSPRYRAEVRLIVAAPLDTNDLVRAIDSDGSDRAETDVRADGGLVFISATGSDRNATRERVVERARAGLATHVRQLDAAADQEAAAARVAADAAGTELAALVNRTGLEDAAGELAAVRAEFEALIDERIEAAAAGRPVSELDIAIADTQRDFFDLQNQVAVREQLAQRQARAREKAADAETRRTDAAVAAESAAVVATVDKVDQWPAAPLALAAFALARSPGSRSSPASSSAVRFRVLRDSAASGRQPLPMLPPRPHLIPRQ